ncbi:MAG: alpha/beta hydrolase [Pararhodobacter sp.]|nr:alpha/beta hydrolase [Pararhodobacter sp.]
MSLQARLLRAFLRATIRPIMARSADPLAARRRFERQARLAFHPPRGARIAPHPGTPAGLWIEPDKTTRAAPASALILHLHGGAYIMGAPETHSAMLAALARRARLPAFLPRYRLAPEHPFPAAFEDACAIWDALVAKGWQPGQIVLGGDSAGGGLALALMSHLCARGQAPAGFYAFSPWTDLTLSGAAIRQNAGRDQFLPVNRLDEVRDFVLAGAGDPADPRISPLFASFPSPPPVLIHAADSEILRDDALRMEGPLPRADIRLAGDLPHVWPIFHNWLPEARATLGETARFIRSCLARS